MAGGSSSRFGRDKALVEFSGKPILARMVDLMRSVAQNVRIVAAPGKYREFGIEIISDLWPGEGPLGGIITALENTVTMYPRCEWNLIVSCDMPFLAEDWLKFLISRAQRSDADVILAHSESGPEPLCACWRTAAVKTLHPAFERGVRKVMDGVKQVKAEVLDERDWKRFDSAGQLFWNINTPADYEEVRRILEAGGK
jgi:molybdopterin-guanine dinucleotide biosynthesis protein A